MRGYADVTWRVVRNFMSIKINDVVREKYDHIFIYEATIDFLATGFAVLLLEQVNSMCLDW